MDKETWVLEQSGDEYCCEVRRKMRGDLKIAERYIEMGDVLHKHEDPSLAHTSSRHRIIVPESLKAFVLGQHHNLELHGHQGRKRTARMVCDRYYIGPRCEWISQDGSSHVRDVEEGKRQDL